MAKVLQKEKVLTYRTQQKESGKRIWVTFPGVEFPYGQGHAEHIVITNIGINREYSI